MNHILIYIIRGSHGFIIGHITPEAEVGGPLALVQDGDLITIDADTKAIDWELSIEEEAKRRSVWEKKRASQPARTLKGWLKQYVQLVQSASKGCSLD